MSDPVIRATGLGKKFLIGRATQYDELFVDALRHRVGSLWRRTRDVLAGRTPELSHRLEEYWALRELDFEIKSGELVSIIGHNGAGKTTLLKILSRITEPTEGRVEITGRVNSLLEVGTGFHPELTGRENIFLNGAILGMTRAEMRQRFDEIVEFSGIAKFLDTPVKRYSVGMYIRLAFAVAAHMEAEILVVDEVLAVGDAEFQAKCLNRMSEVAHSGRTVLFVSHNFAAITALTKRSIVLERGRLTFDGPVEAGLAHYTSTLGKVGNDQKWERGTDATLVSAKLLDQEGNATERFMPGTPLRLHIVVDTTGMPGMAVELILRDHHNLPISFYSSSAFNKINLPSRPGRYECVLSLDPYLLGAGEYGIDIQTTYSQITIDHLVSSAVRFYVDACSPDGVSFDFRQDLGMGHLAMRLSAPLQFTPVAST
ncbi:MAG: ABC transporter ATP-binding protein [Enhydrobacter sp.]|nr:MAG: ABC transporter ATP-binding protein [Enhydrobacter sp.]